MPIDRGIILIAYGDAARREASYGIDALRASPNDLPVVVVSDRPMDDYTTVVDPPHGWGARFQKTCPDHYSPFEQTLYLDADTRVVGDLSAGFAALDAGWDMAIAPSSNQGSDVLWHISADEREQVFDTYGTQAVLPLQPGVIFFARNEQTRAFFDSWRDQWLTLGEMDAGAFMIALASEPVKIHLLGRPWNGGELVRHYFGRARDAAIY